MSGQSKVFDAPDVQPIVVRVTAGRAVVSGRGVVPAKVGRMKTGVTSGPVVAELMAGSLQGLTLHQLFPTKREKKDTHHFAQIYVPIS